MAFPLIPLVAMGLATWGGSAYLNNRAMTSPDFVPRITKDPKGWDARWLGVGIGLVGLLLGPAMPLLGALGLGLGTASLVNWNTMQHVQEGVQQFISRQALGPAPAPFAIPQMPGLPGGMQVPEFLQPLFRGESA